MGARERRRRGGGLGGGGKFANLVMCAIGYLNGGKFKFADASGYDLDNQALVFRVKLPRRVKPY